VCRFAGLKEKLGRIWFRAPLFLFGKTGTQATQVRSPWRRT
jgi:hypothetical protein